MKNGGSRGFVLITTLLLMVVFLAFISAYMQTTKMDIFSAGASARSADGFYAAEAGLNLRAETVRAVFNGYNRPSGSSPSTASPCVGGDVGSGHFQCIEYGLNRRNVRTYVIEEPGNPIDIKIPSEERFGGLSAQEYRYTALSESWNHTDELEARLELTFRSRLVPMFQFAAFYDKDLEILPGPAMTLSGAVHTNGDLYLNANNSLSIRGKTSTAGTIYRGRKDTSECRSTPVSFFDPSSPLALIPSCSSRVQVQDSDITAYNGQVEMGVREVIVPEPESLDPVAGNIYWDEADLRLVLNLTTGDNIDTSNHPTGIEVRNADNSYNATQTNTLHACTDASSNLPGNKAVGFSNSLYNHREDRHIQMLELDLQTFLNCVHLSYSAGMSVLNANRDLDDATHGGLVFHMTVDGPESADQDSFYGVRVRNGEVIQSNLAGASPVQGLTIVTDQAFYVMGHFNAPGPTAAHQDRVPASFLTDTFQVLSEAWPNGDYSQGTGLNSRVADPTTVNAAVLAATDVTGSQEGSAGQDSGNYNGGLENYPRFLESWSGVTFRYRGSFVSLNSARHSDGAWGQGGVYRAPIRDWDYDTRFNDASQLPPLAPRFVYLRQELFVRDFDR